MMIFLTPWAIYLFVLAGGVILLYFLRRRAPPYRVSALFLWEEMEQQEQRAWHFARHSLFLLLLQLLAFASLVLALAGPAYRTAGIPGRLALILDGSASMQMTDEGGKSRYELAQERASELLEQASGEVTVIQAQRDPRLLVPLTGDKRAAIAAVRASRATLEGEAELGELFSLLGSQAPLSQFQRIIYLTDHPLSGLPEGLPLETIIVSVSGEAWRATRLPARNLGLLAFSLRPEPEPDLAAGYGAFIRVKNYSAQEEHATLTITADGETILSLGLELGAGEERALAFSFARPLPGYAIASLEPQVGDDFPWDDRRYFASPAWAWERRVLWLGEEDRFLRGALLAALGAFSITHDPREGSFDLIVANGVEVPPGLRGNLLLVNAAFPPLIRLLGEEELAAPTPIELEAEDHPLLAGVEVANLFIARAARVALPPGGQTLLRAAGAGIPLLYLKLEQARKICYFGFDLRWSNLGLTVDFPILMRNLLSWLLELPAPLETGLEVGATLPLREGMRAIDPRGRSYELSPDRPEEGVRADLPGLYRLERGKAGGHYLAVNLAKSESEGFGPAWRATTTEARAESPRAEESWARPWHATWRAMLWASFALGGLLFLLLEALSYERLIRPPSSSRKRR
ncbi:MAG: vWA domain-containing protein [Candidatus Bipolaricaulia bacterium]